MIRLPKSLAAWNSRAFDQVLKSELAGLGAEGLALQGQLSGSSHVAEGEIQVMVIGVADDRDRIHARVGIFFSGVTAGCSCADDPTPVSPQAEYCEMRVSIDRNSAAAVLEALAD